jgi:hypothetical protein
MYVIPGGHQNFAPHLKFGLGGKSHGCGGGKVDGDAAEMHPGPK